MNCPPQPIPGSAASSRSCCQHLPQPADSCFSLTKSRSPRRPAPARTTTELSPSPPARGTSSSSRETHLHPRGPQTPLWLCPVLQWESRRWGRSSAGGGTSAKACPGQGGGLLGLRTPEQATGPQCPPFGRWGTVRSFCTQPSTSAGVQNFLPIGTASLSEMLVDPLWVRCVNVAKAAVNMGQ